MPVCQAHTNDMVLGYVGFCYYKERVSKWLHYIPSDCNTDEVFFPECEGEHTLIQ